MFYPTTCVGLRYGYQWNMLSGFSREYGYPHCLICPKASEYCRTSAQGVDLPAPIITYRASTRYSVSARRCHSSVSTIAPTGSDGILTVSAIGLAARLILRTRLTPGRLTSPGKPWSYGEGASHPLYRYLYLHLLFQPLQSESSHAFKAAGMLPYQSTSNM